MRAVNSKPYRFRPLFVLMLLVVFATLSLSGAVEVVAEDCDDRCGDECTSVCGCINCPPSLFFVNIAHSDQAALPVVLPRSASDSFLALEQEWVEGIDRPPQSSR
jgi:hypothetical protein